MPEYALLEEKEEPSVDKSQADSTEQSLSTAHRNGPSPPPSLSVDAPLTPSPAPLGSTFPFSPSSVVSLTPARRFASPSHPAASAKNTASRDSAQSRPALSRNPSTQPQSSSSSGLKPNPEEHTNPLSYICYSWLSSLVDLGATRPLSDDDLFEVRTDYAAKVASNRFQREWTKEVQRAAAAGDRSKASLLGPFNRIYGRVGQIRTTAPHSYNQHATSTAYVDCC